MKNKWTRYALGCITILIATYILLLVLPYLATQHAKVDSRSFYRNTQTDIMAHGAGRGLMPGNTLEAAIYSASVGSDVIEIDIHATLDGIIVLRHDAKIDTTTNGTGLIRNMSFEALQAFSVNSHQDDEHFDDFANSGDIKIASLASLFEALPDSRFMIEIKPNDIKVAELFCELIQTTGNAKNLNVVSFHHHVLQHFRRTCPEVATSLSRDEVSTLVALNWIGLAHLYSPKGIALQVPLMSNGIKVLTPSLINSAHRLGLAIDAWTINDPDAMQYLIGLGVDGIITDRPDRMMPLVYRPPQPGF